MAAGFQCFTESGGFVQIDSTYRNLLLVRANSFTGSFVVTVSSAAIAAFRTSEGAQLKINEIRAGGGDFKAYDCTVTGGTAYYFVFDFGAPATNYGLEIYTEASELAFSAAYDYMRVAGNWQINSGTPDSVGIAESGRQIACAPCAMSNSFTVVGDHFPESDDVDVAKGYPFISNQSGGCYVTYAATVYRLPVQWATSEAPPFAQGMWLDVSGFPTSYP